MLFMENKQHATKNELLLRYASFSSLLEKLFIQYINEKSYMAANF